MLYKKKDETLDSYLANKVFADDLGITIKPDKNDVEGFEQFMKRYTKGLAIEQKAVEVLR